MAINDADERAEQHRADYSDHGDHGGAAPLTLPLAREELQVTTRVVDTGRGVRLHKYVASTPQQVEHTLWHEQVEVRHVPVDMLVDQPPPSRYEGDTLVVPVLEEILVKRYRIKEELHITRSKHYTAHTATVTLQSEHIDVARFDEHAQG